MNFKLRLSEVALIEKIVNPRRLRVRSILLIFLTSVMFLVCSLIPGFAQTGGGVQPAESKYHLVRAITGSKGEVQAGRFVVLDPRTMFYLPEDTKILAYFEWDGPLGLHTFEALWKNPEGKVTTVSDFRYEAKQGRFAGYWTLLVSEAVPTGIWTVEAHIDGEAAGSYNFQILSAAKPHIEEITRKILSVSDLYKKAVAATVAVENLSSTGAVQREGLGFFLDDGYLLTAFQTIDGAKSLRIRFADGTTSEVESVISLNRWEDWVLLKAAKISSAKLSRAKNGSWSVGDRCFTLNVDEAGNRAIIDPAITGIQKVEKAGEQLSISSTLNRKGLGAPVLNEYGEVLGLASGVPFPGAYSVMTNATSNLAGAQLNWSLSAVVPISQVIASGQPMSLFQLENDGTFMQPLNPAVRIYRGTIAKGILKQGGYRDVIEEKFVYKRSEGQVTVFVYWAPQTKRKAIFMVRFYDSKNNQLSESKPAKINFDPSNVSATSAWSLPIDKLPNDIYRIDVLVDSDAVWRSFFKIVD